jgi:hypothetical protein
MPWHAAPCAVHRSAALRLLCVASGHSAGEVRDALVHLLCDGGFPCVEACVTILGPRSDATFPDRAHATSLLWWLLLQPGVPGRGGTHTALHRYEYRCEKIRYPIP